MLSDPDLQISVFCKFSVTADEYAFMYIDLVHSALSKWRQPKQVYSQQHPDENLTACTTSKCTTAAISIGFGTSCAVKSAFLLCTGMSLLHMSQPACTLQTHVAWPPLSQSVQTVWQQSFCRTKLHSSRGQPKPVNVAYYILRSHLSHCCWITRAERVALGTSSWVTVNNIRSHLKHCSNLILDGLVQLCL